MERASTHHSPTLPITRFTLLGRAAVGRGPTLESRQVSPSREGYSSSLLAPGRSIFRLAASEGERGVRDREAAVGRDL